MSQIVGLGGSIRCILQGSEAPGGPDSNGLKRTGETGWVRLEKAKTGDRGTGVRRPWRLEVTNVSRIVALGGSIRRILRVSESPESNGLKRPEAKLRDRVGPLRETKDRRPGDRRPETGGSK